VLVDLTPGRVLDRAASVAAGTAMWHWEPPDLALTVDRCEATSGGGGTIEACGADGRTLRVELTADGVLRIERSDGATRSWWAAAGARHDGSTWMWDRPIPTSLALRRGRLLVWSARGYTPDRRVGYGNLHTLHDRDPRRALTVIEPDADGRLTIEISVG